MGESRNLSLLRRLQEGAEGEPTVDGQGHQTPAEANRSECWCFPRWANTRCSWTEFNYYLLRSRELSLLCYSGNGGANQSAKEGHPATAIVWSMPLHSHRKCHQRLLLLA